MQRAKNHVSAGVVLGVIAIVIALTGTSIALPGMGSVEGNDLKAKSVGAKALRGLATVTATEPISPRATEEVFAACSRNQQVIAGGVRRQEVGLRVVETYKVGNGWYAKAQSTLDTARTLTVEAYCLKK